MKKNVGYTGRIIRTLLGAVLITLYFTTYMIRPWDIVVVLAGIVLLLTGIIGFCPFNRMLGINTCQRHLREPRNPY